MDNEPALFDKHLAKLLVAGCVRRGELEGLHAGVTPATKTGNFSDVFVIDADGNKITWMDVSRISQEEMKALMIGTVDRTFTFLARTLLAGQEDLVFEEAVNRAVRPSTFGWNEPKCLPFFLMSPQAENSK